MPESVRARQSERASERASERERERERERPATGSRAAVRRLAAESAAWTWRLGSGSGSPSLRCLCDPSLPLSLSRLLTLLVMRLSLVSRLLVRLLVSHALSRPLPLPPYLSLSAASSAASSAVARPSALALVAAHRRLGCRSLPEDFESPRRQLRGSMLNMVKLPRRPLNTVCAVEYPTFRVHDVLPLPPCGLTATRTS